MGTSRRFESKLASLVDGIFTNRQQSHHYYHDDHARNGEGGKKEDTNTNNNTIFWPERRREGVDVLNYIVSRLMPLLPSSSSQPTSSSLRSSETIVMTRQIDDGDENNNNTSGNTHKKSLTPRQREKLLRERRQQQKSQQKQQQQIKSRLGPPRPPRLSSASPSLVLCGSPGCGKSSTLYRLSEALQCLRTDISTYISNNKISSNSNHMSSNIGSSSSSSSNSPLVMNQHLDGVRRSLENIDVQCFNCSGATSVDVYTVALSALYRALHLTHGSNTTTTTKTTTTAQPQQRQPQTFSDNIYVDINDDDDSDSDNSDHDDNNNNTPFSSSSPFTFDTAAYQKMRPGQLIELLKAAFATLAQLQQTAATLGLGQSQSQKNVLHGEHVGTYGDNMGSGDMTSSSTSSSYASSSPPPQYTTSVLIFDEADFVQLSGSRALNQVVKLAMEHERGMRSMLLSSGRERGARARISSSSLSSSSSSGGAGGGGSGGVVAEAEEERYTTHTHHRSFAMPGLILIFVANQKTLKIFNNLDQEMSMMAADDDDGDSVEEEETDDGSEGEQPIVTSGGDDGEGDDGEGRQRRRRTAAQYLIFEPYSNKQLIQIGMKAGQAVVGGMGGGGDPQGAGMGGGGGGDGQVQVVDVTMTTAALSLAANNAANYYMGDARKMISLSKQATVCALRQHQENLELSNKQQQQQQPNNTSVSVDNSPALIKERKKRSRPAGDDVLQQQQQTTPQTEPKSMMTRSVAKSLSPAAISSVPGSPSFSNSPSPDQQHRDSAQKDKENSVAAATSPAVISSTIKKKISGGGIGGSGSPNTTGGGGAGKKKINGLMLTQRQKQPTQQNPTMNHFSPNNNNNKTPTTAASSPTAATATTTTKVTVTGAHFRSTHTDYGAANSNNINAIRSLPKSILLALCTVVNAERVAELKRADGSLGGHTANDLRKAYRRLSVAHGSAPSSNFENYLGSLHDAGLVTTDGQRYSLAAHPDEMEKALQSEGHWYRIADSMCHAGHR